MHPDTISSWFPKFLARHKLDRTEFKALRHTSATLLLAEGISLKNVSSRLGHSSVKITGDIYARALQSVDKQAALKMDKIIAGNGKKQKQKRA